MILISEFEKQVKEVLKPEWESEFVYKRYKFYTSKDVMNHPAVITLPYR